MKYDLKTKDVPHDLISSFNILENKLEDIDEALASLRELSTEDRDTVEKYYGFDVVDLLKAKKNCVVEELETLKTIIEKKLYTVLQPINAVLKKTDKN